MINACHPDSIGMTLMKSKRRCCLWQIPEANRYYDKRRGRQRCLARAKEPLFLSLRGTQNFVIARSVAAKQLNQGQPVNEAGLKLGLLNKNVSNNSSLEKSNPG